jgi:hypothetical protein
LADAGTVATAAEDGAAADSVAGAVSVGLAAAVLEVVERVEAGR